MACDRQGSDLSDQTTRGARQHASRSAAARNNVQTSALTNHGATGLMMRNLIALELAKHRKNFRNMGLLIALSSAVIAIAFSISGDMSLSGSITYTLNFAFIGSAFLLPLYFGVATANCLRREPDKSTEDCLPASPLRRVWAAYRAGLVYSAALGLVVTIVFLSWQIPQGSNH